MNATITSAYSVKYFCASARETLESAAQALSGASPDLDAPLDALAALGDDIRRLAAEHGDPDKYTDGRAVVGRVWITPSFCDDHVWHPDPSVEGVSVRRGVLPRGEGVWEVVAHPDGQIFDVTLTRRRHDRP